MKIGRDASFLARFRPFVAREIPDVRELRRRERSERELAEALQSFEQAARRLDAQAPEAREEIRIETRSEGSTRLVVVGTEDQEIQTTIAATAARQGSIAFGSASEDVALLGSVLELELAGGDRVRISVDGVSTSLNGLADLLNGDSQNGGTLVASVVEDEEGFRLQIETTATGAAATLTVTEDDFTDPSLQSFSLIDADQAADGTDEVTTTTTTQVAVTERQETVLRVEEEVREALPDPALEGAVEDFVDSYNALRAAVDDVAAADGASEPQASEALAEIEGLLRELDGSAGLEVDAAGAASLDADALQRALAEDAASLDATLRGGNSGLADEAVRILRAVEGNEAPRLTLDSPFDRPDRPLDGTNFSRTRGR